MKNMLVSGLLNVETTVAVRGFPINYYPIDYPFFGVSSNVSGVGFNIARALSTLGDRVELISLIGEDSEGHRVLAALDAEGIGTEGVERRLKNTPTSVVLYDPEGRRQIYCDLKDIQEKTVSPELAAPKLRDCCIAALCNINFNRQLVKGEKPRGLLYATDVHVLSDIDDDYNRDFMEKADILFLSDEKLPCPPREMVQRLWERYRNRVIVIGCGEKGAVLLDGVSEKIFALNAFPCENVVNTVGAGDALFSAFLHFTAKGDEPVMALKKAEIFASLKIRAKGASLGFVKESRVEELYVEKGVEALQL